MKDGSQGLHSLLCVVSKRGLRLRRLFEVPPVVVGSDGLILVVVVQNGQMEVDLSPPWVKHATHAGLNLGV